MSRHFDSWFYTEDFDQEMLDYCQKVYGLSTRQRSTEDEFLRYGTGNNYFWTCNDDWHNSDFEKLTKQQFKDKIGMTTKQFTKSDLVAGMITKYENGDLRLVLGDTLKGKDFGWMPLEDLDDNLSHSNSNWSIVEVFSPKAEYYNLSELFEEYKLKSIWKRPPPKSASQIELEKLQQQIAELTAQANKLQQTL